MAIEVHVAGMGAITPLGTSAALSCAAVRARLSRAQLDEAEDGVGYHRALVDALPPDLPRLARLRALLASALGDALASLHASVAPGRPRAVPLWLALPEDVRAHDLLDDSMDDLSLSLMEPVRCGQASSLVALKAAVQSIAGGRHELALVAGVDVRSDEQSVAALVRAEQLLTDDNAWGLVPSEGAAAVLITSARVRKRLGLPSLGVVAAAAETRDDAERRGLPCIGEGLSQACHEVLDALPEQARAGEIYGDLSGLRARADEWGYTAPRLATRCRDVTEAHMPAQWWGDQGHATGMLLVALALYDGARGHASGQHVLLWASSDGDARAAVLLSASADAPTVVPSRAPSELDREVVAELLSEARFVFGQRSTQRAELEDHPLQGDAGVAASEERLERYLDGLVVMREVALDICSTEEMDVSLAYVMLRLLATGTSVEALITMLSSLSLAEPELLAAAREALSDAGGPLVRRLAQALVSSSYPSPMVALGLWVGGDQGGPLDIPWESVWREGPE
ncbi:MAG TPA: beta-ketoacyl synthase N-terminal-like domain-containing protein, partial [Polyangiales bacterium]